MRYQFAHFGSVIEFFLSIVRRRTVAESCPTLDSRAHPDARFYCKEILRAVPGQHNSQVRFADNDRIDEWQLSLYVTMEVGLALATWCAYLKPHPFDKLRQALAKTAQEWASH